MAAEALANIGESPDVFLPPLREALNDAVKQSARERVWAASALIRFGEPAEAVVDVLIELLGCGDWTAYHHATAELGNLGQDAERAIPALRLATESSESHFAEAAKDAITKIEQARL